MTTISSPKKKTKSKSSSSGTLKSPPSKNSVQKSSGTKSNDVKIPSKSSFKDRHAESILMSKDGSNNSRNDGGTPSIGAETTSLSQGDQFARKIALMSVAHVAKGVGFDTIQKSAADALTEILARYIQRIGSTAKDIAELAGRTQPGATDVIQTLQDLVPSPVEMKDLIKIFETPQRPFPRDVPLFPVRKRGVSGNTIESTKLGHREELPAYAPSFLPPLPNLHTYSSDSKTVVEREQDTKRVRLDLLGQKNQVQQSLHGLQQASFTTRKPMALLHHHHHHHHHQSSWQNGLCNGDFTNENPFLKPPKIHQAKQEVNENDSVEQQQQQQRSFQPNPNLTKPKNKKQLQQFSSSSLSSSSSSSSSSLVSNLQNQQELGKEEKILNGTFYDGDSE